MRAEFTTESRADLVEAASYYEDKEEGLGLRFRDELAEVIDAILSAPHLWRERDGGFRQVNCPVFPYFVAYIIRSEAVIIIAVAHGSRKPGFWHDRLDP